MKNTQVDVSELIGAHNIDIEQFGAQISSKCARAYYCVVIPDPPSRMRRIETACLQTQIGVGDATRKL